MPQRISPISPAQCRAARALLNWSQQDLARAAQVSREAVRDFESLRHQMQEKTAAAVISAFDEAGVQLVKDDNMGEGAFLRPAGHD